jgi:hypothetical protein
MGRQLAAAAAQGSLWAVCQALLQQDSEHAGSSGYEVHCKPGPMVLAVEQS